MENINSPFILRFPAGLPIIRAGEEYFVMPQKLQVLITNEMKTRAIPTSTPSSATTSPTPGSTS